MDLKIEPLIVETINNIHYGDVKGFFNAIINNKNENSPMASVLIFDIESVENGNYWLYVTSGISTFFEDNNCIFELSFRLKKNNQVELSPTEWPIKMLQGLARYSYDTGNIISNGDHIPLIFSQNTKDSNFIKHAFITNDVELQDNFSNLDKNLEILQIVGISDEELNFIQKYQTKCLIDLMKDDKNFCHLLLITDMNRSKNFTHLQNFNRKLPVSSFSALYCDFNWYTQTNLDITSFKSIYFVHIRFNLNTAKLFRSIIKRQIVRRRAFLYENKNDKQLFIIVKSLQYKPEIKANKNVCKIFLDLNSLDYVNHKLFKIKNISSNEIPFSLEVNLAKSSIKIIFEII